MQVPPIVITGFMGCGKTGVARELAARLNSTMADLDEVITSRSGRTPAQLIAEEGEKAFRAIETETLQNVLANQSAHVISLGGGAWIEHVNRALLEQYDALTIWLNTPFEVCWQRIQASDDERPLGKTRASALELFSIRLPAYGLADIHLNCASDESSEDVARRIERIVRGSGT